MYWQLTTYAKLCAKSSCKGLPVIYSSKLHLYWLLLLLFTGVFASKKWLYFLSKKSYKQIWIYLSLLCSCHLMQQSISFPCYTSVPVLIVTVFSLSAEMLTTHSHYTQSLALLHPRGLVFRLCCGHYCSSRFDIFHDIFNTK